MSANECHHRNDRPHRRAVPAACIVFGLAYLLIGIAHRQVAAGVVELAVMLAFAGFLVRYRRKDYEPATLLAAGAGDERQLQIQLRASALTGQVMIVLVVAGLFWSLAADNRYAGVFIALAAIGGATSIASTVWQSRRG